ncbi:jg5387 [Pararge aegeria aegeria]|uniref:MICOS complex subunit MIC10 n=1 Tax=Pararge aegeria aegeria TaxID=348720 RepID=A0A8S4RM19_9NEOP|nr:jg5387 [Pararge aegeria aegeria]
MAKGKKDDSEDEYSAKLDMCLTDGIVKTGSGVLLGAVSSVLFLGRRRWPIIAGMGMGIGVWFAISDKNIKVNKSCARTQCILID